MKKLMHLLFLSCLKATELIEKKLHINLSVKEKTQLRMHKSMCNACRRYGKHSAFIDEALKNNRFNDLSINIEELILTIKKRISEQ